MSKKPQSNRQKKKLVEEGVRTLRNKPGWDPKSFQSESPQEKLMRLDQESRDAETFAKSTQCEVCLQARTDTGDDTALCDKHLAEVMGF